MCRRKNILLTLGLHLCAVYAHEDSLLEVDFCQYYYRNPASSEPRYPDCSDVKAKVVSNETRTLPTLELGEPGAKALFFIHGWPDNAAMWAAQFAHFCFNGSFYCVAVTLANFHPDFPDADPDKELKITQQLIEIHQTMLEAHLVDPTLVVHDWGSVIGYEMLHRYPAVARQIISFDVGSTVSSESWKLNLTYQEQNREAWQQKNDSKSVGSAIYWEAPAPLRATWRTSWPYEYNLSYRGFIQHPYPPASVPLLFLWGNMTRGEPRQANTIFFGPHWLDFVRSTPHGRVVEVDSDHWMHVKSPRFVNNAISAWLNGY
ncbi:hypothetical protein AURANDRAFT_67678 [Aureococcus anophagefferens]|uniref:AB hydrolase-1 domain-containing protein n=1 Tax=Aureococcus anophagefferens TaxID=44056 RepID=F0YM15_AURAN|nr:hypothetical protein AURANDRAFT_67678 [Aureococcus anophagefferens]EGB03799.1 hypothetical protein AURANDRAFT_67678 [Aureococcus anophagefferens]|eukprot:XP_009041457.1 hypothetical protein AURANDRAFT_67678 [Aureococcus anophagefferens]